MEVPVRRGGEIVKYATVSPEDYEEVVKLSWTLIIVQLKDSEKHYAQAKVNGTTVRMHQFVLGKAPNDELIDHRNGEGLCNARPNLRYATHSQNNNNRPKLAGTTSKYIGVSWKKSANKWSVKCGKKFVTYSVDEVEAAIAFDKAAIKSFGLEAKTNGFLTDEEKLAAFSAEEKAKKVRELPLGVYQIGNRFRASANIEGKSRSLGMFKTVEEAEQVACAKRKEIAEAKANAQAAQEITRNGAGQAVLYAHNRHGDVTAEILVDENKWHELSIISWWLNQYGYAYGAFNGKDVAMHQYLVPNAVSVNHRNNNKLDMRVDNLRSATVANQNQHKTKIITAKTTSKFVGVSKVENNSGIKWRACISIAGKSKHLGHFETEFRAAAAYNAAALKAHDDPLLNVLPEDDYYEV